MKTKLHRLYKKRMASSDDKDASVNLLESPESGRKKITEGPGTPAYTPLGPSTVSPPERGQDDAFNDPDGSSEHSFSKTRRSNKIATQFGLTITELVSPSKPTIQSNPADSYKNENQWEDADLHLGSTEEDDKEATVEAPYSGFPGPMDDERWDEVEKDSIITRGASLSMQSLHILNKVAGPSKLDWVPAFKNVDTNKIIKSPGFHDPYLLPDDAVDHLFKSGTLPYPWVDGFLSPFGNFFTRDETKDIMGVYSSEDIKKTHTAGVVDAYYIEEAMKVGFTPHWDGDLNTAVYLTLEHELGTVEAEINVPMHYIHAVVFDKEDNIGEDMSLTIRSKDELRGLWPKFLKDMLEKMPDGSKEKEAVAIPDTGGIDENKYEDPTGTRQDKSIPRGGPIHGM